MTTEEQKERIKQRAKGLWLDRMMRGVCTKCGEVKSREGFKTCEQCTDKERSRNKARKAMFKRLGICTTCQKKKAGEGRIVCVDCSDRCWEYRRATKAKNPTLCLACGTRQVASARVQCGRCISLQKARYRRKQKECKGQGLCIRCCAPLDEFSTLTGRAHCPTCNERKVGYDMQNKKRRL